MLFRKKKNLNEASLVLKIGALSLVRAFGGCGQGGTHSPPTLTQSPTPASPPTPAAQSASLAHAHELVLSPTHTPSLQASPVVHRLPSSHFFLVPAVHLPALQRSLTVQTELSALQGVASLGSPAKINHLSSTYTKKAVLL